MLTREQAVERLAQWRLPEDSNRLADAVGELPAALRDTARAAFDLNKHEGQDRWIVRDAERRRAALEMHALPREERAKIFQIVAPGLAATLEATWQLLQRSPYQIGYTRKAFRAPGRIALYVEGLGHWLESLANIARAYRADALTPGWLATWAVHLPTVWGYWGGQSVGPILAGAIDGGGEQADEVFEILRQSLTNQHEVGAMGHHVVSAFLLAGRPEGWELIEKTLLAAQRQEGLRQSILEAIDLSHPQAFARLLRIVLDHDLIRFAATVRAVNVWFGDLWSAATPATLRKILEQLIGLLDDPAARGKALAGKDAQAAFLALWSLAKEDCDASIAPAAHLLKAKQVELRYVAARHLAHLHTAGAMQALIPALDDHDLRVAQMAVPRGYYDDPDQSLRGAPFEALERLFLRLPREPQKLKPLVWPWNESQTDRPAVAHQLTASLGDRRPSRLLPHLPQFDARTRQVAVTALLAARPWDAPTREALFDLVGDAATAIREAALRELLKETLAEEEVRKLEGYLTRKSGDLRRGLLALLAQQPDVAAVASGRRLLAAKDASQRLAGLELLRGLVEAGRLTPECRAAAAEYAAGRKKLSTEEQSHLAEIAKEQVKAVTLDDALGLMNPAERTPVTPPRDLGTPFFTPAAFACLASLDELIHQHRETPVTFKRWDDTEQTLVLGTMQWGLPHPNHREPPAGQEARLPLAELWLGWEKDRPAALRDGDGMELLRAALASAICNQWQQRSWLAWFEERRPESRATLRSRLLPAEFPDLRYHQLVAAILAWLLFLKERPTQQEAQDYLLNATETVFSLIEPPDQEDLRLLNDPHPAHEERVADWREAEPVKMWHEPLGREAAPYEQAVRLWKLMHWCDRPIAGAPRRRVSLSLIKFAHHAGLATLADLADHLLGPRGSGRYGGEGFDLLSLLTARGAAQEHAEWLAARPEAKELVERAVERILELELNRGDNPTAATAACFAIRALHGVETLRRILHALGKTEFKLGHRWRGTDDRRVSLTQLAKVTYPGQDETAEDFARVMREAVRAGQFPEERLLQLTFLAPQWTKFLEAYFGWEGMSEGVYWFLAHMHYVGGLENAALAAGEEEQPEQQTAEGAGGEKKSGQPGQQKLSPWERLILERTPLTDAQRREGAIDVAWFRRTHAALGDKHWQALAEAARFAANASQAKRAKFIAEVLLQRVSRAELIGGIKKKQLKEHVRLLGLLPLAKGKKREADLRERCQALRDYRRYANTLSGLTKPDALRAWEVGMMNLAQTAGFPDPLRLEWSVGAEELKFLAQGPKVIKSGDAQVTLALDHLARPELTIVKAGRVLKSIPPATKKQKEVAAMLDQIVEIKRQASSIRQSLEMAMCRGDTFRGDELRAWCGHALLAPLLARLVVVGEGIAGYPDKGGKALRNARGKLEPVKAAEELRIAHPHDLFESGKWQDWQRECFAAERLQPFKQVFRELYLITKQEKKDGTISHRYDGHQIQPRQGLALFGSKGWNTAEGVFKTFHREELTVHADFSYGVTTPAEVEAASIAGVWFHRRDAWKPMKLVDVPPRIFSEVMRDLDLVVSVAHAGGVDPEASASTVEMRSGLVRETTQLLGMKNVRLKANQAVIDGELAQYTVHLGSGVVHRMPGGSLCIVPVHAQQRGRLFLPFADDDPRTAEVISKILLLARDREIQDPTILEQLRR